jgi:hypothetical protein
MNKLSGKSIQKKDWIAAIKISGDIKPENDDQKRNRPYHQCDPEFPQ